MLNSITQDYNLVKWFIIMMLINHFFRIKKQKRNIYMSMLGMKIRAEE